MVKTPSKTRKKSSVSGTPIRDARTRQFTLGREAFERISSVEGIAPSKVMHQELARTSGMSPAKRRSELAAKFGKN